MFTDFSGLLPRQRQQLKHLRLFRRSFDVAAPQCKANAFQFLDVGWRERGSRRIVIKQVNLTYNVFAFVNVLDCFLVSLSRHFCLLIKMHDQTSGLGGSVTSATQAFAWECPKPHEAGVYFRQGIVPVRKVRDWRPGNPPQSTRTQATHNLRGHDIIFDHFLIGMH